MDRQEARKYFNTFFQNNDDGRKLDSYRRVAICQIGQGGRNRIIRAISGKYFEPIVPPKVMAAFRRMLERYDAVNNYDTRELFNCAEAHLWVQLVELYMKPAKMDVYVARKINGRAKRDSPCLNCKQWARFEFRSLNQV